MKKQLLSTAIASTLAIPAGSAMAIEGANGHAVKLYGRFQVEWVGVSSNSRNDNTDPLYLVDNGIGRWGIFAQEKLGNGITAFGRLEQEVKTTETNEKARARYLGVKGKWGLFLAGRQASPYKVTGGTKVDPFSATTLEARNGGGFSSGSFGHNGFLSDIFLYASPNWGGFSFSVAVNPENEDEQGDDANYWSAGAQYKNGPIWVWGAYSDQQSDIADTSGDDNRQKRWKLGAKGTMGAHSLAVQYENADGYEQSVTSGNPMRKGTGTSLLGYGDKARFFWLAYIYKAGNNTLMLSYGDERYDNPVAGASDGRNKIYTFAARHNFSRTFNVFGGIKYWDLDNINSGCDVAYACGDTSNKNPNVTSVSVGFRKDFSI